MNCLRVGIDARLVNDEGGVSSFVIGLASGLSSLTDGDEEYFFLTYRDADEWLRPHLKGACRILPGPLSPPKLGWKNRLKNKFPVGKKVWDRVGHLIAPFTFSIAKSDGTIERAGIEIMHFTTQGGFLTDVINIYHPHDLQHVHSPHYFSKRDFINREIQYRTFCDQAKMIAVASSWTKNDLIKNYGIREGKINVVPLAPVTAAYLQPTEADLSATKQKYGLSDQFIFYPAQTWEHKNHLGLIEALYLLRERQGISIPFVSSGIRSEYYSKIESRIKELQLEGQTKFLGFVSTMELQCLYKLCHSVVIPTKFEAASFPLWEAFLAGAPTACSHVTSLPQQAGDACLIFDPERPEEIAEAILRLWTDKDLRITLKNRGRLRVAAFSWERTARTFRAHYRRLAGRPLSEDDLQLFSVPPLL
jgi:glycosyltransferase involved in cell wall biosynthesis